MSNNVIKLGGSVHFSVEQALDDAKMLGLTEVVVLGTDSDGRLVTRSSSMSRAEALYLCERGKFHAMGIEKVLI